MAANTKRRCNDLTRKFHKICQQIDQSGLLEYVAIAHDKYQKFGRGVISAYLGTIDHASTFAKSVEKTGVLKFPQLSYLTREQAMGLEYPEVIKMVDEYDPRGDFVLLIAFDLPNTENCWYIPFRTYHFHDDKK